MNLNIDFWKRKRVLITGGAGFIGRHLISHLAPVCHVVATKHIHGIDLPNVDVVDCDLRNRDAVDSLLNDYGYGGFDVVFHLAACPIVRQGEIFVNETLETNINGTINLLESIRGFDIQPRSIVVASTDKVYGRHDRLPYFEDFAHWGNRQIYEVSKLCADNLSQAYGHSFGMRICISRFGNVYGPGDWHFSRLIPGVIRDFMLDRSPVIRSDGQHYRDYVYIDDVVNGYLSLARWRYYEEREHSPVAFNFGSGKPARVMDIASMIATHFPNGQAFTVQYGASDEIHRQYLDYSLASRYLDWYPSVSLADGIAETVDWYKDNIRAKVMTS